MTGNWDDSSKEEWLRSKGIDVLRGAGSIAGPGRVTVDGREQTCDNIVLATGSEAVVPPIPCARPLHRLAGHPRARRSLSGGVRPKQRRHAL